MNNSDMTGALQDDVAAAAAAKTPLRIVAGGSKAFYGRRGEGTVLDVSGHRGIVHYQPTELVVTARAATPLAEIEAVLAEQGQMLAFEPPYFASAATLGGTVACGFSGPRRPFTGAARDFVLGCRLLNGKAEVMRFGGEAIKNVAGFDVSRLMAGALGTLGLLLEISLKVLPLPACERSRSFELDFTTALQTMRDWQNRCLPLSALCYADGRLYARLSGSERAVADAGEKLGGDQPAEGDGFWRALREQQLEFFRGDGDLWRIAVPPATPELALAGRWLYDWGGALRWLKSLEPAATIFAQARRHGGHALLFRGRDHRGDVFQPLPEGLQQLHRRVKQAFDPHAVFNPGRMYRDL
ncbi:MAG: glycolate oxidase subunit GlcE [Gammaproteobacteria bacterium]